VTTIYVTHDQVEAMTLGDRVAIMRDGVLQQFDRPQKLYDEPRNLFVAEFIGSPAMNLVDAELADGGGEVRFGEHRLRVPERVLGPRPALPAYEGKRVILGIRPEDLEDASIDGGGDRLNAVVDIREDMGSEVFAHFAVDGAAVRTDEVAAAVGEDAAQVAEVEAGAKGNVWVARLDRDTRAAEGQKLELAIDTGRLHFFDPQTGEGIYRS
jgi:multiple sugar transport system ATP-binding protein